MSHAKSHAYWAYSVREGVPLGGPYQSQSPATALINRHIKYASPRYPLVPGEVFEVHEVRVDHGDKYAVVEVVKTIKVPE